MVFFLNEACDTPANNGYLERFSWYTSLDEFSPMLPYDYHIYNKFFDKSAFCSGKISGYRGGGDFNSIACVTSSSSRGSISEYQIFRDNHQNDNFHNTFYSSFPTGEIGRSRNPSTWDDPWKPVIRNRDAAIS